MLTVETLSFSYGQHLVLEHLSLPHLEPGQLNVLLGPNGSGKSTFFKCIAGFLRLKSGQVALLGKDVKRLSIVQRLKEICYVPQRFLSDTRISVFEAVLLARKQSTGLFATQSKDLEMVEKVLQDLQLTSLSQSWLNEISGGQQQKVIIAQALIQKPSVLLMDEPTSALDLKHQLDILDLVKEFTQQHQITTIVALHDLNLACRFADQLLLLHQGAITVHGEPSYVVQHQALQDAYQVRIETATSETGVLMVAAHQLQGVQ